MKVKFTFEIRIFHQNRFAVMGHRTPRASVSSCVIEADVLHNQTAFYDVGTEVFYLQRKSYNTEQVL